MNLMDIAKKAISYRRYEGFRYPEDVHVTVARNAALKTFPNPTIDRLIDAMAAEMDAIERPHYSNPTWDGSIG